ncbi:NFX1-type zinc finger-containing protein 1 [Mactra antiquata]
MNRDPKLVSKGLVSVHFEHEQAVVRHLVGQVFTMAETTAYFESYRHVLKGLQNIRDGDLPFERYIIQCERLVHAPEYIRRRPDVKYDLRPLVDEDMIIIDNIRLGENIGELEERVAEHKFTEQSLPAKEVSVLDQRNWPPSDLLHLDESQYRAIRTALTKEFAITQGPPGTGKTYIGLKIVKALLHNKSVWSKHPDTGEDDPRPMLIVCYTNHALDQFLEGIDRFYKGDIVRVGSRSTSEILKPYGLHNFRQRFRHAKKIPAAVYRGRREAKNEMESVMSEILLVSAVIQQANTCIIHEKVLRNHMGRHYNLLMDQFHDIMDNYDAGEYFDSNRSIIVEWLELGNLQPIVEMEGNMSDDEQMIPNEDADENLIDVDFEVDAIQEQRQLDNQSDDDDDDGDDLIDEQDLTRRERLEQRVQQNVLDNRHNVALDVESITEKPKNVQANEWEIQKGEKKKMKKKLQKNLASGDIMMEEEANRCTNLWKMKIGRKWRLYRLWVLKYSDHLRSLINEKEDEFDAAAKRYQEALMQEDKEILKNSTIIGMTTTGAAKYQRVLQELKPRIIVVEEAAEVLEAHVVTTLSRGCEHLVLIGDHKQLKPNPTVYKLATNYNLDVSLFERMVENGIRCDCLELQHRMKPEISELMKHIYENLRDHDDVKKYEAIKGIACNMFFIDHKNEESHNEDLRSHSNVHEANYIKHLCKYLLLQGYRPEQITVLTLYSGQLFCLRRMMPKDEFNGVRVTVVDNYQGEENDIILLSLVRSNNEGNIGFLKIENRVCVALSRAKKGFYVIGNFDLLKSQSKLWNEIVIDMKNKDRIGEGLELYCQNHPDNDRIVAKEPTDFLRAPEGGCNQKCTYRLDCGHVCEMYCHVTDQEHANYDCHKKCGKTICKNGHKCQLRCGSKCSPCLEMVPRQLPKCGHVQQTPCSGDVNEFECKAKCKDILRCGHKCQAPCGRAHTQNCNEGIRKIWPCGHEGIIACYQKDTALCPAPCDSQLDCDHRCSGTCGECFQGRLHKPCSNDCIRILVCGHECTDTCNQCPPCTRKCENRCAHSKCNRGCGELCTPCMEPCEWQCEHYQCEKLCSEPCDRPRCDQPCRKDLKCGHQCIGLCGEPCPPDCKECDKEKVTTILFGEEDEPYARFVLMEDCRAKCIIESGAMDKYMDDIVGTEIKLRECPLCKTTIRKSNRYKEKINRTLQDIEGVKKNVLHNMGNVRELEGKIQDALKDELPAGVKLKLKRRFKSLPEPKSQNALVAISNQIAFLKEVTKLEEEWKERVRLLMFNEDKLQQLRFIQHFKDWLMIERTNMSPQENRDAEFEISRAKAYLLLLLHQQKAKEISKILDRGLQAKIAEAEKLVKGPHKYQENLRLKVEACLTELKNCCPLTNLGISEKERLEIVTATQLPTGHWFKCPNGHIYAIGECGGANETSKCPECGCTIGGTNHHLQDDNQLANEMDGAQHAAWSEQANLLNYGFNAQF